MTAIVIMKYTGILLIAPVRYSSGIDDMSKRNISATIEATATQQTSKIANIKILKFLPLINSINQGLAFAYFIDLVYHILAEIARFDAFLVADSNVFFLASKTTQTP